MYHINVGITFDHLVQLKGISTNSK